MWNPIATAGPLYLIRSLAPSCRRLAMALGLALTTLVLAACGGGGGATPESLAGEWRAVLTSPGGELPFVLRIFERQGPGGAALSAVAVTAGAEDPASAVTVLGSEVRIAFAVYDSEIVAQLSAGGNEMVGRWRKRSPEGYSELPFAAHKGVASRFRPASELDLAPGAAAALPTVEGAWAAEFTDDDGTQPALGELSQRGREVTGTFLTPTGDYRFLEGSYEKGILRLSTFDGAHAFLFVARAQEDGSLAGDFYSRDSYHATWTARRAEPEEAVLPDAWSEVGLRNDAGRFAFRFPDLDGEMVSLDDPRFAGKVVVVVIFGTWCPNCNDEAPLLAEWYRRWHDDGLEVVGLAYEHTGDEERDRRQLRRFAARYGIDYPLLLAGVSDKAAASETLPDLTGVLAYPTTLFIGRQGRVRRIHSGFSGPGTGQHYVQLVEEMEGEIRRLLAESAG